MLDKITLRELARVLKAEATTGEALIAMTDEQGKTMQYRTIAKQFEDAVNWFVAYGSIVSPVFLIEFTLSPRLQ